MLKRKNILTIAICTCLLLLTTVAGCTAKVPQNSDPTPETNTGTQGAQTTSPYIASEYDNVKEEDIDSSWDESAAVIKLSGDSILVQGNGAKVNGNSLLITEAGTYVLEGTLNNGQITIEAPDDALVRVVLNGVNISNEDGSAINCVSADKLVLILADGTQNYISDGENYTFPDENTDEPNATIFSKQDLTINGMGELNVSANYNNGIGTKDDLILVSGNINVEAANHAIRGRDSVIVIDATLKLDSGNDGIQSNNDSADSGFIILYGGDYTINSANDGIQAQSTLTIHDGNFSITAGGGSENAPERADEGFGGVGGRGDMGQMPDMSNMPDMSQKPDMDNMPDWGSRTPPDGNVPGMPPDMNPDSSEPPAPTSTPDTATNDISTESATEDTSSGSFKAIKSGGDLIIKGGVFNIDSADDAVHSNTNVTICGGSFTISTGDDAMHADEDLLVEGETTINIITCYEGLEGNNVTINSGDITLNAADDGINAAGGSSNGTQGGGAFGADKFMGSGDNLITINGGTIHLIAGYDGLDSNGGITITGGELYISAIGANGVGGDGALDCDGTFTITGGTVAGTSGTAFAMIGNSANNINAEGTQPMLNFQFTNAQEAGTVIEVMDAKGDVIIKHTADKDFKAVALSSPQMKDGESYTIYANGDEIYTVTLSGTMTSISDTGESVSLGIGPGGGGMGGRGGMNWNGQQAE
ncbi:carbohydrate-binding domain-containing protein [Eubacteriales bacterium OttesenSCG-928-K08]|nr:carbohydrate-binding domain-containing protein [Eubacteriales bacterium OttesenSCG-928-K08]